MIPGIPAPVVAHIWQSTLFASLVWLATLGLQSNAARVRYWLWMASSLKFLVPFSWLVMLGAQFEWRTGPVSAQPAAAFMIDQVFAPSVIAPSVAHDMAPSSSIVSWVAGAVWLVGIASVCFWWWRQWMPVRAARRAATRVLVDSSALHGLTLMSSPMAMEPGIVGVWRPVLLVPEGLLDQLTAEQRDALIAHERSHVRHRDNLLAAVHMAVEALFWFHPLVWWIERRLIDERERACDEDVLRSGSHPADYAEGILAVCRLSVRAPLACVSGVTGSDLRRRIESILRGRLDRPLSAGRRCALALTAVTAVGLPIVAGTVNAVPLIRVEQEPSKPVAFAVASVKVNRSGQRGALTDDSVPGRFTATNVPVTLLIRYAYDVSGDQIESAPDWTRSDAGGFGGERFDVTALLEEAPTRKPSAEDEQAKRLATRTLLAERFKLAVRREMREVPMYALVMARTDGQPGPRLKRSSADCSPGGQEARLAAAKAAVAAGKPVSMCGTRFNTGRIRFGGNPMSVFAKNWRPNGRTVIDRTGLTGNWEFELTFMPDQFDPPPGPNSPPLDPDAPSLPAALQEQLGLKLEDTRGTIEVLVVERVERPTEN
jgi:bla regulator protein blaR1